MWQFTKHTDLLLHGLLQKPMAHTFQAMCWRRR
jgi:hypothetical protein